VFLNDQVKVDGVPMPVAPYGPQAVTSGVVQGSNIGYIYAWDWMTTTTRQLFSAAVDDLIHVKKVEGLILDFRMNWGGYTSYANDGYSQLFNFDPTDNYLLADRTSTNDHMGFSLSRVSPSGFSPASQLYDRPIAVLIGPGCFSAGDHNAFRMRFHPKARLFGMSTNGAFVGGSFANTNFSDGWRYYFPTNIMCENATRDYMIHKGVQPDEAVWITREGAARGEDDVVKRAIAWIRKTTSVETGQQAPTTYALRQNYPNPFNPSTTISYSLPKSATVTLKIFNALGQEIASLVNERKEAGYYQATWNANAPSGVYFYRLQAGEFAETRKLVLVK
jgi:hypothetical protein